MDANIIEKTKHLNKPINIEGQATMVGICLKYSSWLMPEKNMPNNKPPPMDIKRPIVSKKKLEIMNHCLKNNLSYSDYIMSLVDDNLSN